MVAGVCPLYAGGMVDAWEMHWQFNTYAWFLHQEGQSKINILKKTLSIAVNVLMALLIQISRYNTARSGFNS